MECNAFVKIVERVVPGVVSALIQIIVATLPYIIGLCVCKPLSTLFCLYCILVTIVLFPCCAI